MNDASFTGILSTDIDRIWPEVAPLLEKALHYADGKIGIDDLYTALKEREMQLWLVPGGVWVGRIVCYPKSKRLEAIAAAGEWRDWNVYGKQVMAWAKARGCDAVEIIGRPGWGRKTGFEEIHRTFRVRL